NLAAADGTGTGLSFPAGLSQLLQRAVEGPGWILRVRRASVRDGQAAWTASDGARGRVEGLDGEFSWSAGAGGAGPVTAHVQAARLTIARENRIRRLHRASLRGRGTAAGGSGA